MADSGNNNNTRLYHGRVTLWRRLCTELYQEQVDERQRRFHELVWAVDHSTTADDVAMLFASVAANADLHFAGERLHEIDDPAWPTVEQLWEAAAFTPPPVNLADAVAALSAPASAAAAATTTTDPAVAPAVAPAAAPDVTITVASPSPPPSATTMLAPPSPSRLAVPTRSGRSAKRARDAEAPVARPRGKTPPQEPQQEESYLGMGYVDRAGRLLEPPAPKKRRSGKKG